MIRKRDKKFMTTRRHHYNSRSLSQLFYWVALFAALVSPAFAQGGGDRPDQTKKANVVGAWQTGIFENDAAMDYLLSLARANVEHGLLAAVDIPDGEYIEEDVGIHALVAAAIIAALKDGTVDRLPSQAQQVTSRITMPLSSQLVARAQTAARRILLSSETKELREALGGREFSNWKNEVEDLIRRLGPN